MLPSSGKYIDICTVRVILAGWHPWNEGKKQIQKNCFVFLCVIPISLLVIEQVRLPLAHLVFE